LVNDVLNDIISSQKQNQDAQSLQIIKEFYHRELTSYKAKTSEIGRLQEQVEVEKSKRVKAE
jgi:hypothetical protein